MHCYTKMWTPDVLTQLETLDSVTLQIELRKATRGHKYEVHSPDNVMMFKAKPEYKGSCKSASITVPFNDAQENQIMQSVWEPRSFHRQKLMVYMHGRLTAKVVLTSAYRFVFYVYDFSDRPVFRLKMISNKEIELQSLQKQRIGYLKRRWRGFRKEIFARKAYLDIHFPINLTVEYKIAVIAAAAFIDIIEEGNNNSD